MKTNTLVQQNASVLLDKEVDNLKEHSVVTCGILREKSAEKIDFSLAEQTAELRKLYIAQTKLMIKLI